MRLPLTCPHCKRRVAIVDVSLYATEFRERTCPKCRTLWQIMITPRVIKGGWAHILDWEALDANRNHAVQS